MSLIDTVIAKVTQVVSSKDGAVKLVVEARAGNYPDDIIGWHGEYVKVVATAEPAGQKDKDVYIPAGEKTPIEKEAEKHQTVRHEVIIKDERAGKPGEVVDAEYRTEGPKALGTGEEEQDDGCHNCKYAVVDESEAPHAWNCTHEDGMAWEDGVCNNWEEKED
jgi:hypothetical protein